MRGEIRADTLLPFGHQLQREVGLETFFFFCVLQISSFCSALLSTPSIFLAVTSPPPPFVSPHPNFPPTSQKAMSVTLRAHPRAHPHTRSASADIPVHQQVTRQVCRFTHFISACSRNGGGGGCVGRSKLRQIATWPLGQVCFPLIHCRRPERQAASLRLKILNICWGGL